MKFRLTVYKNYAKFGNKNFDITIDTHKGVKGGTITGFLPSNRIASLTIKHPKKNSVTRYIISLDENGKFISSEVETNQAYKARMYIYKHIGLELTDEVEYDDIVDGDNTILVSELGGQVRCMKDDNHLFISKFCTLVDAKKLCDRVIQRKDAPATLTKNHTWIAPTPLEASYFTSVYFLRDFAGEHRNTRFDPIIQSLTMASTRLAHNLGIYTSRDLTPMEFATLVNPEHHITETMRDYFQRMVAMTFYEKPKTIFAHRTNIATIDQDIREWAVEVVGGTSTQKEVINKVSNELYLIAK